MAIIPFRRQTHASDEKAVAELFDHHAASLRLFAASVIDDRSAADDAVQQAFFSLLRHGLAKVEEPKSYLYRAVRNAALNLGRTETRERHKRDAFADQPRRLFDEPREPADELDALNQAMDALNPDQREVVVLKVWGGLTFAEIAKTLGIPPNTAASRYRYGIARLKEAMGKNDED